VDTLLSEQMRLFILVVSCGVLLSLESILPLYSYGRNRLRRTLPNVALTALLVLTNLLLSFATASVASLGANRRFGLFFLLVMPTWVEVLLGIAALDLFAYCAHVLLHKSWVGWQFHRVHHSDGEVNVTTSFRQHPGETFWRVLWKVLAVALFGIPLWIVVIYLTISAMNAQLEHTNVRLNKSLDTLIRLVFVTPNMHKIHHSREQQQTDTNYSNIFSFWDRIFGTYTPLVDFSRLRYGLNGFDDPREQTLTALLKNPFLFEL
jgi:sterol desaturase/sphingolipid hydroxylase (fatty acid hydroxylase superfamily)